MRPSRLPELAQIPNAWQTLPSDLPRLDWVAVNKWVAAHLPETAWEATYQSFTLQWFERLAESLQGEYAVYETPGFTLLSALPPRRASAALQVCSAAERFFSEELPGVAQICGCGPEAILMFAEIDDFARYIAHYFPESDQAQFMGGGVHLGDPGNPHIALPELDQQAQIETVLVHELAHASLCHHQLPRWLDEGLAMRLERRFLHGESEPQIAPDTLQRTLRYWNPDRIQDFWSGESFNDPVKGADHSYTLADLLITTIARNSRYLADFASAAEWRDGGNAAAREHLGLSLGEIAGLILGEGGWEPHRLGPDREET